MDKKIKYDFELKLKFLNFFFLAGVMPPPRNFLPKMDIRGGAWPRGLRYLNCKKKKLLKT